jgi:O-antigen/teichoic acid export membrane protein
MKEMRFRALFYRKVVALPVAAGAAIALAFNGYGIWALVAEQVLAVTLATLLVWRFSGWTPRFVLDGAALRSVAGFSSYLTLTKITNYFTKRGDVFLVGSFLGAAQAGFYSKAYGLGIRLLKLLNGILMPVMYPALSRMQSDRIRLRRAILLGVQILAVIYIPLFVFSVFLARPTVYLLLGDGWAQTARLVPFFTFSLIFLAQDALTGQLLKAVGESRTMFRVVITTSIITVGLFTMGLRWGMVGVAGGFALGSAIKWTLGFRPARAHADVGFWDVWRGTRRVLGLSAAAVVIMLLASYAVPDHSSLHPAVELLVLGVPGFATYALGFYSRPLESTELLMDFWRSVRARGSALSTHG